MEWDTAAGHIIAECAGAQVFRADNGEPLLYNKENLLNPWFFVSNGKH
jgi:3'(2'), 5'-bisphosphate nucleotidase